MDISEFTPRDGLGDLTLEKDAPPAVVNNADVQLATRLANESCGEAILIIRLSVTESSVAGAVPNGCGLLENMLNAIRGGIRDATKVMGPVGHAVICPGCDNDGCRMKGGGHDDK